MSVYIYANPTVIDILADNNIVVTDVSKVVYGYGKYPTVIIELPDDKALEAALAIGEEEFERLEGWFREVGRANTWFEPQYRPRVMRQVGLAAYICDAVPESVGASQPRNVAAMIGEIAAYENKTPIELYNSLSTMKG